MNTQTQQTLTRQIAQAIEDANAQWEAGRATSPDEWDYVYIADSILADRLPGYERVATSRGDEFSSDPDDVIAREIFDAFGRGELGSSSDLAAFIVGRLLPNRSMRLTYQLTGLQGVEPDELPKSDDIVVTVDDELDSMGFHTVSLSGPTWVGIVDYVREGWGADNREWFKSYVLDRIELILSKDEQSDIFHAVEEAWYQRTKGELWVGTVDDDEDADRELSTLVLGMARTTLTHVAQTASVQYDGNNDELAEQAFDIDELARRIAAALDVLFYGGKA